MNVVFLDYDGVVNTLMWDEKLNKPKYAMSGKVNNWQAVQWVSEFCIKYGYSIVVSSTWRLDLNYKQALIDGGLREGIEIVGRTGDPGNFRREEIGQYLKDHPEIKNYLIFDDETIGGSLEDHLVRCTNVNAGFGVAEYERAVFMHEHGRAKVLNEKMVRMILSIRFCTDGDFSFTDPENVIDKDSSLYNGCVEDISCDIEFEEYLYDVICCGTALECRYVARDFMQTLITKLHVGVGHYYLMDDVFHLLDGALDVLFESEKYEGYMSGNYEGTSVSFCLINQ